jgi:Flp pilus assembly protein TadD
MSDIDDPSTPRFFSKQKNEIDDILSDIDNDLSDDVMDIESFDDIPAEPLKASKPFGASKKSSFGGSFGKSNFVGGLSSSRQSSSSKLLAGTVLALLVVGGAGGAYYYFTQGDAYSTPPKIAAPLTPPPPAQDPVMMPSSIDEAMPALPTVDGAVMPSPDMTAGANVPTLPNQQDGAVVTNGAVPSVPPQDSLVPQIASDVDNSKDPVTDPKATPPSTATATTATSVTGAGETVTGTVPNNTNAEPIVTAPVVAPDSPTVSLPNDTATTDGKLPPLPQDGIIAPKLEGDTSANGQMKTALKAESKTDKVTKPSTQPEKIKYFDSPAGEVLEDIQPPSIDVTRNPGESIIIVKKPVGYDRGYSDGAYSNRGDGTVKIERSEVTATMAQKAVMADRALRLGRYDMAIGYYQDILAQNPNDVTALLGRAIALQKSGNEDAALQGYRDVLNRDPSNVTAATNMAGLQSGSNPDNALKNLSNVYNADPNNVSVKAQMGVSMAQSGNVEEAYNVFLSATKSEPRNPVHFYNLAVTAEKLGKTAEAIAAYEKCLEVDAIYGTGRGINRDAIYDRLSQIRGR